MKSVTPEQVNELVRKGSLSVGDRLNVQTLDGEGYIVSKELVLKVTPEYVETEVSLVNGNVITENFRLRYYDDPVGSVMLGLYNTKSNRRVA